MSNGTATTTEGGDDFNSDISFNKQLGSSETADPVVVHKTLKEKRETLQKKPSSADLQSRLKSRKLLGVGVTDDGMDIHRSKVSQILGHNENMLTANKEPIQWLLKWNCFLSALFFFTGTWSLLLPQHYSHVVLGADDSCGFYYSISLLCFALPLFAMSQAFTEHDAQMLMLTAVEIMLAAHCVGAYSGAAVTAAIIILFLLIGNTTFLAILYLDAPNKFAGLFRKFSQSRDDDFHLPGSDKKDN